VLQRGVKRYPENSSLQICLGEVLAQAGNPSGALKAYAAAARAEPGHPMPYLNASKLYQQMNQLDLAREHMRKALRVDSSLAITLVDIAQFKIHESRRGGVREADVSLDAPSLSTEAGAGVAGSHADHLINAASATVILDCALDQARHVSEIIDVFTAKKIAGFYLHLQGTGLAPCMT
jgi:tetratricopeptide (TPR) repeat protein